MSLTMVNGAYLLEFQKMTNQLPIRKFEVTYTARFKCTIEIDEDDYENKMTNQDLYDLICADIDIPEGGNNDSEYVAGSFEISKIQEFVKEPNRKCTCRLVDCLSEFT